MLQDLNKWGRGLQSLTPHLTAVGVVVLAMVFVALVILAAWDWFFSPMFGLRVMDLQEAIGASLALSLVVSIIVGLKEK